MFPLSGTTDSYSAGQRFLNFESLRANIDETLTAAIITEHGLARVVGDRAACQSAWVLWVFSSVYLVRKDSRWIDVAFNFQGKEIEIQNSVLPVKLPKGSYVITLFAHGKDCGCEKQFILDVDQDGLVVLAPVP